MTLKEQLKKLAGEKSSPCVTISLNTSRTHPDNAKDEILLKNLLKEAQERVVSEFGKRAVAGLLEKMDNVATEIDVNYNLDSLHIFLSNNTTEIVKSAWPATHEGVQVADSFALRPIIKSYNRSENYLLMVLSQKGVELYEVVNDTIIKEIRNEDFPFIENRHYNSNADKSNDAKHHDDLLREFFNNVDKALVKVHHLTDLNCVVICTDDNYSKLLQVADLPSVYRGYAAIDYNKRETHHLVKQSWEIIKSQQKERRIKAIAEVKEAIASGNVLTDLQEIFQAAKDGRGDLLIVHQDFSQAVIMKDERSFDLTEDKTQSSAIDDITSAIAWDVLSKKGRVYFTSQAELKDLGNIVLKTRY